MIPIFRTLFVASAVVAFSAVLRETYQQASAAGLVTVLFGGITAILADVEEQRSKKQQ